MTTTNKDKAIERARKLFAMSQCDSSPAEAEIAGRRLHKILDEFGISMEDVVAAEAGRLDRFGESHMDREHKSVPGWYSVLAYGVAIYFDCQSGITISNTLSGPSRKIGFKGFDTDVLMCTLMMEYLVGVIERGARKESKSAKNVCELDIIMGRSYRTSPRKAAASFRSGFACAMQKRMKAYARERQETQASSGTSLVVLKNKLVEERFGSHSSKRAVLRVSDDRAYNNGVVSANNTGLNRQVSGHSNQRALT